MGRSGGGLTTKIHALVDAHCAEAERKVRPMMDAAPATCSMPWLRGRSSWADRAYDSDELRRNLNAKGAWANIKPMPNRKNVPAFSTFLYRYRNLVERFFNKIKHYRAVATRYDKRPENFLAGVKLVSPYGSWG